MQRISVNKKSKLKFDIILPAKFDQNDLSIDLASDSYIGLDYSLPVNLHKAN